MLNEIIEAEGYLFDPEGGDCEYQSLNTKLFCSKKGELNGLDRAMTTVARYFLFEDGAEGEQAIARAGAALRMWCGLMPEGLTALEDPLEGERIYLAVKYPWIDRWLPIILEKEAAMEKGPSSEIVQRTLQKLYGRRDTFTYGTLTRAKAVNDFKLLSYEKVIANALIAWGPLRKYYLACDDPDWFSQIHKVRGGDRNARPMDKDEDKVIKLLAAYMLEANRKKKRAASIGFEPVNLNAVAAWLGASTKFTRTKYTVFSYDERELFEFEDGPSGNTIVVRPDADWFRQCGWTLIDATDGDDALDDYLGEHPDAVFYSCEGGSKPLARNARYAAE